MLDILDFKQTSEEHSDCSTDYDVKLRKEVKLSELIGEILKRKEWGDINVKMEKDWLNWPKLEFSYGKIIENKIPKKFMNKKVARLTSNGGWTQMHYYVEIENKGIRKKT